MKFFKGGLPVKTFKTILFYILSFTWGAITSIIGLLMVLGLLLVGYKPKRFNNRIYVSLGGYWGGMEMGPFFFTDGSPSLHIKQHESGHGIQNIVLGPFMLFVVAFPSCIRYWLRECRTMKAKYRYAIILSAITSLISLILLGVGIFCNLLALAIIGGLLLGYWIIIAVWLILYEIPKYKTFTPFYDDIWFEHSATKLGEKYYPEDR